MFNVVNIRLAKEEGLTVADLIGIRDQVDTLISIIAVVRDVKADRVELKQKMAGVEIYIGNKDTDHVSIIQELVGAVDALSPELFSDKENELIARAKVLTS